MKQIFEILLEKWWLRPTFAVLLMSILVLDSFFFGYFNNGRLIYISITIIILITLCILQRRKTKFKHGCLISLLTSSIIIISSITTFFAQFSLQPYTRRLGIEKITGVDIPKISDRDLDFYTYDFDWTWKGTITFKEEPDEQFYQKLDQLCQFPIPKEVIDNKSPYISIGLESTMPSWSKQGNTYIYDKWFFREQPYPFDFYRIEITKGSKQAKISIGII